MEYTFEMNNAHQDDVSVRNKFRKNGPVAEVFSSMVKGEPITTKVSDGKIADKASKYITTLAKRAEMNDSAAISELNALRVITIEPMLNQELKMLNIFGSYRPLGWNETPYVESYKYVGVEAHQQAEGNDVTFPAIKKERYPIAPVTISGGHAVNYRQLGLGDAAMENQAMEEVRKMIRNKATLFVMKTIVDRVENADGVKYFYENAGLEKTSTDEMLTKIRRFGRPNVIGDYAILSQFTPWLGFSDNTTGIKGISDALINEINDNGIVGKYNGSILNEIQNPYNLLEKKDGNFVPLMPEGTAFVIPQGGTPSTAVQMFSIGGLTSFSGNDATTGEIVTRMDMAFAADVVKGREYEIGVIQDTNLTTF